MALALGLVFVADGAGRWRSTRCSLRASHPVSDESKQSMVEIEREPLQGNVKLDSVAAVWAWVAF